jgi:hypothetical protein
MEKQYKSTHYENYIKKNAFFLITHGAVFKARESITLKRFSKNHKIGIKKALNIFLKKKLENSIFCKKNFVIKGPIFLLKGLEKKIFINFFELFFFNTLLLKLNDKMYSNENFRNISSLKYKNNMLIFYKFRSVNLKRHTLFN